jgi:hypothetical protein
VTVRTAVHRCAQWEYWSLPSNAITRIIRGCSNDREEETILNKSRHPTRFFNKIHVFTRTRTTLYIHENFRFSETSCFFVVCFQAHFDDDGAAAYTKRIGDRLGGGVGLGGGRNFCLLRKKSKIFLGAKLSHSALLSRLYFTRGSSISHGGGFLSKLKWNISSSLNSIADKQMRTNWRVGRLNLTPAWSHWEPAGKPTCFHGKQWKVAAKKQDKFTAKKENDEIPTGLHAYTHARTHHPMPMRWETNFAGWSATEKAVFFLLLSHRTCTNLALQVGSWSVAL